MFSRGVEHLNLFRKRAKESPLWAHCINHHNSQVAKFTMEKTGSFQDALSRQISESVNIHNFQGISMNRKAEWRQPAISRVSFNRSVAE